MKNTITKYEYETVITETPDNSLIFGMFEDFADRNPDVMELVSENGTRSVRARGHVGVLEFSNGTQLEIYPSSEGDLISAKKTLARLICTYHGITYEENAAKVLENPDNTFLEFFISVFTRECMNILKSGLLAGYTSVEENTTAMQGSILFSENIRKNLAHRERLYVRHDVFTPDRSENRLIKKTAMIMSKLSHDRQNYQNLKKILIFLDEVRVPVNYEVEFANCINTRNTLKYSAVLSICRMFLRRKKGAYVGKYVSNALLYPIQELRTEEAMQAPAPVTAADGSVIVPKAKKVKVKRRKKRF